MVSCPGFVFFSSFRVEHATFSDRESKAFTQLCRVLLQDFLPFVKRCFESLYSESSVEPLALSTPYTLRHCKKHKPGVLPSSRPGVEIEMELDVKAIGETLRGVAPEAFDDLEHQSRLSTLSVDVENLLSGSSDQPTLIRLEESTTTSVSEAQSKTSKVMQEDTGTTLEMNNVKSREEGEQTAVEVLDQTETEGDSSSEEVRGDGPLLKSSEMLAAEREGESQVANSDGHHNSLDAQLLTEKPLHGEGIRTAKLERLKEQSSERQPSTLTTNS